MQSPLEYATNGERQPLGRIVSSKRLLEAAGWEVFVLNAGQLPSFASEPAMLGTVGRFLHSIGFTTDWKATAASAPRSDLCVDDSMFLCRALVVFWWSLEQHIVSN